MQPSTHAADATDRFDPWGFGTTAADEPTIIVAGVGLDAPIVAPPDDTDAHDAVLKLVARVADSPKMPAWPRAPWPPAAPAPATALAPAPEPAFAAHSTPFIPSVPSNSSIPSVSIALPSASLAARLFSKDMAGVLSLCALVIVGQAFYIGFSLTGEVRASAAPTGEVVVSSHPSGAHVAIDGRDQGVTPVVVSLPVGRHRVDVTSAAGTPQTLDAEVTEGARWTRHVELAAAPVGAAAVVTGALRIDTAVAGAAVWIDGALAGRTPLAVPAVGAGPHTVRVQFASGTLVERRVALDAGETVSLVLDAPVARAATPTGPASGWVHVQTPFDVQVLEAGQVVGSSASERIMVTAGPHVFELVNAALGFRATVKAVVGAGRTEPLIVDSPRALVQVNAQPWAEVLVDGRVAGDTPLANLQLAIGVHQFVFRHPEFGERSQTVTVRLDTPNRVTADLRR